MKLNHSFTTLLISLFSLILFFGCHLIRVAEEEPHEDLTEEEIEIAEDDIIETIPEYLELTEPASLLMNTTASGIDYAVLEPGTGEKLEPEMQVSVHYAGYLGLDNTKFDSSYDRNEPILFTLGRNMVITGWDEVLTYLRVGDKARVWIPSELAYGEKGRGPIPPNADLIFDLEVLEAKRLFQPEKHSLAEKDTVETDSGLQIIIISEGSGEPPARGSVIVVHYSGYLSDGSLFDSSLQRNVPLRFVYGTGQVLRGWDEGFAHLNKGAKARFILPPHLAYGDRGAGPIPPDETLIFDVELLDIEY